MKKGQRLLCSDAFISTSNDKLFYKILYLIFNYPHKHYTFKHFEV